MVRLGHASARALAAASNTVAATASVAMALEIKRNDVTERTAMVPGLKRIGVFMDGQFAASGWLRPSVSVRHRV
jgi:hypothetical protein